MWIEKDEITKILVENIIGKGKKFEDLQESWFTKHLIIALREAMWVLLLMAKMVYENITVRTSTGSSLDDKGYDFGIDRKGAVKSVHSVTLHKSSAVACTLKVPDGFLLSTTPVGSNTPVKFIVVEGQNLSIENGKSKVENVLVECIKYGNIGNVPDNAINLVSQAGFDYVTNSKLYKAGAEQEKDEPYRARILERKRKPSRAGVPADWERWALEVKGVSAAKCYRCARGAGTADIVILGENGDFATEGLIVECQKYIDEKYMPADLSDGGILIVSPEGVTVDISITNVVLKVGYTNEMVETVLRETFKQYFKSRKFTGAVTVVDCIVCIRTAFDTGDSEKSPIVEDFVLELPNKNIPLTGRQLPLIGSIAIEVVSGE